ncbi:DNA polymerase III subunit epsilon [Shewanella gelidii]|uniref:DNA polymerase III subunit epsilon n=2 Tax=Shewanella gelidii TaxID=1642821 RepID=A0A917NB46_9GAMM|nr:DNA polymerase III subunit epsilon [Shewanella gelidii]
MLASFWLKMRLRKQLLKCKHVTLQRYLEALNRVLNLNVNDVELVALDLEMTGLDPQVDQILSIGIVPISHGQLQMQQAEHKLIKIDGSVGQSATIHGILDHHLEDAVSIEEAIEWLLEQTQGKFIVAHHAPLDIRFLQVQFQKIYNENVKLPVIDTLMIERNRLLKQHETLQDGALRLGASRARYNLPVYNAHNALIDALACGELLLAQIQAISTQGQVKIADIAKLT